MIAVGLLAYQLWVTAALVRAEHLSRGQRYGQLAFVWLVPVAGELLCHRFLRLHKAREPANEQRFVQRQGLDPIWYREPTDDK